MKIFSKIVHTDFFLTLDTLFKDVPEVAKLKLYMEHHIEMDGDIHSVLSRKIVAHACDSDEHWEFAKTIGKKWSDRRISGQK